jgi:peptidoglycan/xylan/chitin deacetylase (PgdA/CDA1 family)
MIGRYARFIFVCLLLTLATGWNVYNSELKVVHKQVHSFLAPHKTAVATANPKFAQDIPLDTAPPVIPQLPLPPPQPLPAPIPPPPPPSISAWQGEIEQMPVDPTQIPALTRIPTTEPVVFLGIDDGLVKSPEAKDWLLSHKMPFTLFLTDDIVKADYDYFRDLQSAGMTIQDHTITHSDLTTMNLDQQRAEICGAADKFGMEFGSRPTLFRPPYGSYNSITKQAAADCGMKALIIWHAKANGGSIQFQDGNTHFLPGDIVLMHFRPEFLQDMKAFTDQVTKDGLQVGRLEDWIQ